MAYQPRKQKQKPSAKALKALTASQQPMCEKLQSTGEAASIAISHAQDINGSLT